MFLNNFSDVIGSRGVTFHTLRGVGGSNPDILHHHDLLSVPVDLVYRLVDGREQPLAVRGHSGLQSVDELLLLIDLLPGPHVQPADVGTERLRSFLVAGVLFNFHLGHEAEAEASAHQYGPQILLVARSFQ